MVSIDVQNIGLKYRITRRYSLERSPARPATTGGVVTSSGRGQFITALDDVSLSLTSGDRLGIVGPNGAGKTTLLKVIYGIFEPTAGRVNINGRVDALFNINLGFRREASGRRNIILRGLVNGRSKQEMERRMDDIVEFSELGEFIDMPIKTYSQGMAARLAFSVATALDPEILLMDEWIGAGDAQFQEKARARMNGLAEAAGIIILASHNENLIKRTCNKILALEGGRRTFSGDADEYFAAK